MEVDVGTFAVVREVYELLPFDSASIGGTLSC